MVALEWLWRVVLGSCDGVGLNEFIRVGGCKGFGLLLGLGLDESVGLNKSLG